MKIYTCTPVSFVGDCRFMTRDSGLLSKGLQQIGVASRIIMPLPAYPDDVDDVIRVSIANMEKSEWWNSLRIDALVFYGWGDPKYKGIVTAIRKSGVKLIQNLDTVGIHSPYADFWSWLAAGCGRINSDFSIKDNMHCLYRMIRDCFPFMYEKKRLSMIDESDFVTSISTNASQTLINYSLSLGFQSITKKIRVIPHPVNPKMYYTGQAKKNQIVVVGRWSQEDTAQKDPKLTIRTILNFLQNKPAWSAAVIGRDAPALERYCRDFTDSERSRLELIPALDHVGLIQHLTESKISLCASRYESFHIASAEAVCCGCSVVVANHALLASTCHFTEEQSGTIASDRSAISLLRALMIESDKWDHQLRNPTEISNIWCTRLHANQAAKMILDLLDDPVVGHTP